MKKKMLSLALTLALCLGLAVPAFAAGTTKTVVNEEYGISITMDGFLRTETHSYDFYGGSRRTLTIYVLRITPPSRLRRWRAANMRKLIRIGKISGKGMTAMPTGHKKHGFGMTMTIVMPLNRQ